MAQPPPSKKPNWSTIEKAAIAGASYPQLAKRFGVTLSAVKKQASRGKWPVPARIMRRARELSPHVTDEAVTVGAECLNEIGEKNALLIARFVSAQIKRDIQKPMPISQWSDLSTAHRLVQNATGRDKPQVNIGLQFCASAWRVPMSLEDIGAVAVE